MSLKEWYDSLDSDYNDVMARMVTEERVIKYLKKFQQNTAFANLENAWKAQDYEAAFRGAHNLKGVTANLGLTKLHAASDALCEDLRGGTPSNAAAGMLEDVRAAYSEVMAAIETL